MEDAQSVYFSWNEHDYQGYVEKEYDNSYLIVVQNPCSEITSKFMDRMIISKKLCTVE